MPFYRAFITDHIVSPENGEASRRLAGAMQQHLLTREPYRSYNVTLEQLFEKGSFRVHEDLYILSDQVFGWDSRLLGTPRCRSRGRARAPGCICVGSSRDDLRPAHQGVLPDRARRKRRRDDSAGCRSGGRGTPRRARASRYRQGRSSGSHDPTRASGRCGPPRPNGTSSSTDPSDRRRFQEIERETAALFDGLPDRTGNAELGLRLNQLSRWFPRPWMWIARRAWSGSRSDDREGGERSSRSLSPHSASSS